MEVILLTFKLKYTNACTIKAFGLLPYGADLLPDYFWNYDPGLYELGLFLCVIIQRRKCKGHKAPPTYYM